MKTVIEMAREAGFYGLPVDERLERFAALVREDEREACIDDVRCVGGNFAIEAERFIRIRGDK